MVKRYIKSIADWMLLVKCGERSKDRLNIAIALVFSKLRIANLIVNKLLKSTIVKSMVTDFVSLI